MFQGREIKNQNAIPRLKTTKTHKLKPEERPPHKKGEISQNIFYYYLLHVSLKELKYWHLSQKES